MRHVRTNPQREFLRHTIRVPLEVHRVADSSPLREQSVNVSFGGLAFVSSTCPAIGEVLRLRIPIVEPAFEADARVAWCRPEAERFLVGVAFLDSKAGFQSRMVQQVCSIEHYRQEVQEREGRTLTAQEAASEWIGRYAGRFPDSGVVPPGDSAD
jgi:c-di-GMP-binding flagellar brake protein YcgR